MGLALRWPTSTSARSSGPPLPSGGRRDLQPNDIAFTYQPIVTRHAAEAAPDTYAGLWLDGHAGGGLRIAFTTDADRHDNRSSRAWRSSAPSAPVSVARLPPEAQRPERTPTAHRTGARRLVETAMAKHEPWLRYLGVVPRPDTAATGGSGRRPPSPPTATATTSPPTIDSARRRPWAHNGPMWPTPTRPSTSCASIVTPDHAASRARPIGRIHPASVDRSEIGGSPMAPDEAESPCGTARNSRPRSGCPSRMHLPSRASRPRVALDERVPEAAAIARCALPTRRTRAA